MSSSPKKNKAAGAVAKKKSVTKTAVAQNGLFGLSWPLFALLGLAVLIFLIARIRLLAIPLERDEGSFAYIGHWLLRGRELYTDMLDSKLPGLYAYYGFFTSIFGLNAVGVHIGLLVANIASAICFFLLAKGMFNRFVAATGTSFFLLMIISPNVVGFASHATQLLTPFVLAGFLFFWHGLRNNKQWYFLLAGICIGIAFTIKQQSAIFGILLAGIWWLARAGWMKHETKRWPVSEWILLGVGGFLPVVMVLTYFLFSNRFDQFIDWTITQPVNLAGAYKDPWYVMLGRSIPMVMKNYEPVWVTGVLGLILVFISDHRKISATLTAGIGIVGFVSVVIGAAYYNHYFVVALPGIAMLAACTLYWISMRLGGSGQLIASAIACLFILFGIRNHTHYYFNPDYARIHFENYSRNMFPELEAIGKELKKRVPEGQKIAIMGSEPEVLVNAGRESCSKYLMVYAMLFDPVLSPPMQQEYVNELTSCMPEYVVWSTGTGSWAPGYDGLPFFENLMQWIEGNYQMIGMAESRDDKPGLVLWDDQLKGHKRQSDYVVFVYKRKPYSS